MKDTRAAGGMDWAPIRKDIIDNGSDFETKINRLLISCVAAKMGIDIK